MHDPTLTGFMAGALCVGFIAVALYFLKFWRKTRDSLFLTFAAGFLLLALGQATLGLANVSDEARSGIYLLRLAAFLLIIWAIFRKNRRAR
jgi:membrane-associated PAP2 superfamily phosphatase